MTRVGRISPKDRRAARAILEGCDHKRFSLTDCNRFALTRRLRLGLRLASDHDSRAYPLNCRPALG